ncbi:MAG: sulfite exporter TauE/SafE family protein [Cyanobacteriota bacterium]
MTLLNLLLLIGFAVVAFLYAGVGHGGASGYIALMALAGLSPATIKPVALILNIVVASLGCWNFLRAGHLPWRTIWPVYLLAIPGSFLGGWLNLPGLWFRQLVGGVLIITAFRLGLTSRDPDTLSRPNAPLLALSGGAIGFLAGLTGTGGGVLLTPFLLLCNWCTTREAAATSVLFILFNSISGLAGLVLTRPTALHAVPSASLLGWLVAVLLGGALGSRLGSRHWPVALIRRLLALVLLLAAFKLLGLQG